MLQELYTICAPLKELHCSATLKDCNHLNERTCTARGSYLSSVLGAHTGKYLTSHLPIIAPWWMLEL